MELRLCHLSVPVAAGVLLLYLLNPLFKYFFAAKALCWTGCRLKGQLSCVWHINTALAPKVRETLLKRGPRRAQRASAVSDRAI